MRAKLQFTLFCECNHALTYVEMDVVTCTSPRCPNVGKHFRAPSFELDEIVPDQPADASNLEG